MPAFTEIKEKFEVQAYAKAGKMDRKKHLPFSGSPRKHPQDPGRIILVADPFTPGTFYYEFRVEDIGFAEELPSISNLEGESVPMARIWVRKKSVGIRSIPFLVEDLSQMV
jgi:inorganic pyrophosphatase